MLNRLHWKHWQIKLSFPQPLPLAPPSSLLFVKLSLRQSRSFIEHMKGPLAMPPSPYDDLLEPYEERRDPKW